MQDLGSLARTIFARLAYFLPDGLLGAIGHFQYVMLGHSLSIKIDVHMSL